MRYILQFPLFLAFLLLAPAVSASQTASLEQLIGSVELRRVGQDFFKQAIVRQHVKAGDILRTGADGKATLRLVDGSTLCFAEETEFMLGDELKGSEKKLIGTFFRGVIRAILKKQARSYIATPTGAIGIRGTDITFTHSGKTGFYFLSEGGVGVSTGKDTVILEAGNMTASYAGRPPLPPSSFTKSAGLAKAREKLSMMTSVKVPSSLKDHALLNEILARWISNYAHYLAESGQHDDAETALLIAKDLTARHAVEGEILLQIGGLYFYRLNDVHSALKTYERIIREYGKTPYLENALFGAIRCSHLLKQQDKVLEYTKQYKKQFPNGKHLQELDAMTR